MDNLIPILLVLFLSNLIQSTFSFGGALIAIPLLVLYMDVGSAAVLLTIMSLTLSVFIVLRNWKNIDFMSATTLIISSSIGIPIGVYFVVFANEVIVKLLLSFVVIAFSLSMLFNVSDRLRPNAKLATVFGFVSGVFGGAYNISGPPVVMYGVLSGWSPEKFRSTVQSFALKTNAVAVVAHYSAGNITSDVLNYYLYSLPMLFFCLWLGGILHRKIPADSYKKYLNYLLIVLSINLAVSVI